MMLSREIKEYESGIVPASGSLEKIYIMPHSTPATIKGKAQTTSNDLCNRMSSSSFGSEPIRDMDNSTCWNNF